jgi:hypothetical protein
MRAQRILEAELSIYLKAPAGARVIEDERRKACGFRHSLICIDEHLSEATRF